MNVATFPDGGYVVHGLRRAGQSSASRYSVWMNADGTVRDAESKRQRVQGRPYCYPVTSPTVLAELGQMARCAYSASLAATMPNG